MVDVVYTDEFGEWWLSLDEKDQEAIAHVVGLLEERGTQLGFPYSSQIQGSEIALRELRKQSKGRPLRVFYAFDPARQAALLIGGDKTGDDDFYDTMIPLSEKLWKQYLTENFPDRG